MPNWCQNEVEINGSKEEISKFLELVTEKFDFDKIIPMPKELENTTSGSNGSIEYQALYGTEKELAIILNYSWVEAKNREELIEFLKNKDKDYIIEGEKYKNNIDKYGYTTWYEWSIENWGTKWSLSDENYIVDQNDEYISFEFDTAWSPPEGIYTKLVELFPELNISWFYKEPGMQISGWL